MSNIVFYSIYFGNLKRPAQNLQKNFGVLGIFQTPENLQTNFVKMIDSINDD